MYEVTAGTGLLVHLAALLQLLGLLSREQLFLRILVLFGPEHFLREERLLRLAEVTICGHRGSRYAVLDHQFQVLPSWHTVDGAYEAELT